MLPREAKWKTQKLSSFEKMPDGNILFSNLLKQIISVRKFLVPYFIYVYLIDKVGKIFSVLLILDSARNGRFDNVSKKVYHLSLEPKKTCFQT